MGDNAGAPWSGRGLPRELWVPVAVLAAYVVVRIGAVLWGIVRDGLPASVLAGGDLVSDGGAVLQAVVGAAVLARPGLRRIGWAWGVGVVGMAAALSGATVWVVLGDGNTLRQVRQILLAVAFAVATLAVCGWRPGWARHRAGGIDLARVRRMLWLVAGCAVAVGAVSGLAVLTVHPAGALHRCADLMLQLGLLGGFVAVLCVLVVVGEQRRQAADAERNRLYQGLVRGRSVDEHD